VSEIPWIGVCPHSPYFIDDNGRSWTPIGQNDAISWPGLDGLIANRDVAAAERYLRAITSCGVTCVRLMLEYCEGDDTYFEKPASVFNPQLVRLWDKVFAMCGQFGLRALLTPFDTF
jgi:hypothetical protein